MEEKCFLHDRSSSECGSDHGSSECISLLSCNEIVTGHLAQCHLLRESLNEYQLILARAGLFDLNEE